jgi:NADH-quinone oxidoreductase subunit M
MLLGVVGILYGAKLAYAQSDLKRLIAYSSLSHMGFIMVGAFSFSVLAYQGVVMQMVAHALSIAGLFLLSEAVFSRIGSFDMNRMGRFWETMPRMGGMTVVLVMASLGLPGLANFVAEFLVLAGAWQVHLVLSVLASVGLISSVIYSLVILQKVFHERESRLKGTRDLSPRELLVSGLIIVAILWLGLFPSPVIHAAGPAVQHIVSIVNTAVK